MTDAKLTRHHTGWYKFMHGPDATTRLPADVAALEADLKEAVDIIQWLVDLQNGCPLDKYRVDWERETARAYAFLKRKEKP